MLIPTISPLMPSRNKARYAFTLTDDTLPAEEQTVIDGTYTAYMVKGQAAAAEAKVITEIQADIDKYKKNKKISNTTRYKTTAPANILAALNTSEEG